MFCYNCGIEVKQDHKFCFSCGTKLDLVVTQKEKSVRGNSLDKVKSIKHDLIVSDKLKTMNLADIFYKMEAALKKECSLSDQQLSELRDWLLPMLMNGQVKVT